MNRDEIPGLEDPNQMVLETVVPAADDRLASILKLAKTLVETEEEIATAMGQLEILQKKRADLAERRIPDLMLTIGLTELRLTNNKRILIKPEYFANISQANKNAAFDWLKANNMAGIVKEELSIEPGYRERLMEAAIPFGVESSVHASTLKAFIKEQVEANNENLPRSLFGVHVVNKAVVKNG